MNIPVAQTEPPSSQLNSYIFVNSANQSLRVFVEAAQVVNRPKLIRRLRTGGATICDQVAEAEIILVDPETPSGAQLIQDWAAEKVILDSSWVQKSVERGRSYLAAEGWGGFVANSVANGFSEASGSNQAHLPTPRETPSEQKTPQGESVMQNQNPHMPSSTQYAQGVSHPPGTPYQSMTPQMPNGQPVQAVPFDAILQSYPNAPVTLPAHLVAQMMSFMHQQQGMNTSNLGMSQMPQMPNQMPMNMLQGQAFPPGFPQQSMPFMSPPSMFAQASYQSPPQGGGYHQMSFGEAGSSMVPNTGPSPVLTHRRDSISAMSESHRGSPMDVEDSDISPSLKRKKRSVDASGTTHSSKKSKKKSKSGGGDGRPLKHRRMSESYDEDRVFSVASQPSPLTAQSTRDLSDGSQKLFIKDTGAPYHFFVQVEIRNRSKIADAIKRNGGRMEPNISDADFVILGHPTTKNFEEWLRQSGYFGKLPVKPQWVLQCVEQNEILELDEYLYEGFKVEKKRGRPFSSGQRYVLTTTKDEASEEEEESESEEEEEGVTPNTNVLEDVRRNSTTTGEVSPKNAKDQAGKTHKIGHKPVVEKKTVSKGKAKANTTKVSPPPQANWAPSPPPPTRVAEQTAGKNLYTKEELDYCEQYIPILLSRDPAMTLATICEKIHSKMPHHTSKAWQTHLTSAPARREKFNAWRKRAEIVQRKEAANAARSGSEDTRENHIPDPPPVPVPAMVHQSPPSAAEPFDVMVAFFADGRADNLGDSEVWVVMGREFPQLSAQEWEKYWCDNSEAIAEGVTRRNELRGNEQRPKSELV